VQTLRGEFSLASIGSQTATARLLCRLEVELREISEDADRARKQREDLGVELYGMQQQLARLQSQLETTHNNSHLIGDIRKKSELDLERLREVRVLLGR
jgi:coiled-coil domain-containing protein 40